MKQWTWLIGLICMAAAAGYLYTTETFRSMSGWPGREQRIAVRAAPVHKAARPLTVHLSGALAPLREVEVISPLPGRVTELRFKAGDKVRAGAIVATLHSNAVARRIVDQETAVAAAEKEFQAKAQQLDEVERQLVKYRELHSRDLIAARELAEVQGRSETARAQIEFARAYLTQQQAMLAQARALGGMTIVKAPLAGVVTRRLAEPGTFVGDSAPILVLADAGWLKLTASVEGELAAEILTGLPVEISSPLMPGQTLKGKVVQVELSAKLKHARVEIHAVANEERFYTGMAVEAQILLGRTQQYLWAPGSAVISAEEKFYVYIFSGGRALRREVTLGAERNGEAEIKTGLAEGDLVIVDGVNLLTDGKRVSLLPAIKPRAAQ